MENDFCNIIDYDLQEIEPTKVTNEAQLAS